MFVYIFVIFLILKAVWSGLDTGRRRLESLRKPVKETKAGSARILVRVVLLRVVYYRLQMIHATRQLAIW